MKNFGKFCYKCMTSFEEWLTMPLMALAIVLTVINVIARYIFKMAIPWSQEVVGIAWTWTCMLGISWCFRRSRHAGVDFLIMKVKPSIRRWIQLFTYVILFVAMVFLLYMSFIITKNSGTKVTNYFQLPYSVKYISAVIAFFNMTVYSLIYIVKAIVSPDEFVLRVSIDGNGLDPLDEDIAARLNPIPETGKEEESE